ncbi:hypothetical protein R4P64_07855 [Rhodococcus sp. IEGM 1366]|uniref:hypothetical protein n=1 Tax=Rhodococcus sp. IEGM 1366 TaxID=3082223 RepID=UPI002955B324|nr:hypothetical protein [Rhodococcus sp. IEGM 1366]MDV8066415.1 hypothetical protein [Rhodococcus sp. IEGM 1366]
MSDLDAEGVVFDIYENLPRVEGFGAWNQTDLDTFAIAKRLDLASGFFEIATPDDDVAMIHLVAPRLPVQAQHAPEFGAAMDHAYDMTNHKNGITND